MTISNLVEKYDEGLAPAYLKVLRGVGIVFAFFGWILLLWTVPDGLIKDWMGNREFANWSLIFSMLILFYYGSESFYLTFAGGFFLLGNLLGARALLYVESVPYEYFMAGFLGGGYLLLLLVRMIAGTAKAFWREVAFIPVMPVWIFRFLFNWMGISI